MPSWMTSFNLIVVSSLNLNCITISKGCTKDIRRKYTVSISYVETSFLFSYAALDVTY